MLKGSVEYNKIGREIDPKLLRESIHYDYKDLYDIIYDYYLNYKTPPSYELLRSSLCKDIDTFQLVSIVEEESCEETEILYFVEQLKHRLNKKIIKNIVEEYSEDDEFDLKEFNKNIFAATNKIERLSRKSILNEGLLSNSVEERIAEYSYAERHPNQISGVFSGYKEIDDMTFGIKDSELMIISGASSSGKSLLMMNMAINAWMGSNIPGEWTQDTEIINNGKNILYITLEMSKRQMEQRIDSNIANIRHKALSRGLMDTNEKQRWAKSLEFQKAYDKKFYIVDMPRGTKTIEIEARYDALISEFKPELVCIDYLGIMSPNKDYGSDWLDVGQVGADVHELCRRKNIPIISAAQRKAKNKSLKTQTNDIEDVGRSKILGDSANILLLIETRDDEMLREDMIVHVVKNRDGAKGAVKLIKDFATSKIADCPDNWTSDIGDENRV
jgi:replicative DNA helicase